MSGGPWAPYKELASTVNTALVNTDSDSTDQLQEVLKKHKPDFISLLKNPARKASDRQQVMNAVNQQIPSLPNLHTLPQDFIDEALILSDILGLNELSAVELMVAGEQQLPRFPNLTRGLVAVLLYYDGRRSLVSTLRTLIQAREGVAWVLVSTHLERLVTQYTNNLLKEGLVDRILYLLDSITVDKELEALSKGRAVGEPRHRAKIVYFIEEIRSCLADCLLYWTVQNPFTEEHTLKLIGYLAKVSVEKKVVKEATTTSPAVERYSPMSSSDCVILHALFGCFNIGEISPESAMDENALDKRYPAQSPAYVWAVHQELWKGGWACKELHSAVMFGWAVLLREEASRAACAGVDEVEQDLNLMNSHLGKAVQFLRQAVLTSSHFQDDENLMKIFHRLLTSFIVNYPLKIKDLRNHGDEVCRDLTAHGLTIDSVPLERREFEQLMILVGEFYSLDNDELQLSLDFWSHDSHHHQAPTRSPQRQISLYKFITTCSDLLPAPLFPALMSMLTGLATLPISAHHMFNFLKANSPSLGGGGSSAAISLEHFFLSLKQYFLELKKEGGARATLTGCPITPLEVEGLRGVLSLIRVIAKNDESARVVMYENQSWLPVASLFGLVSCSVPRQLRADILQTLAVFALTQEIAASMWHTLEASQILTTVQSTAPSGGVAFGRHGNPTGGIKVELNEMESQLEDYSLTRAFLALINSLTDQPPPASLGAGLRVPGFSPYLEFVRDDVLMRFDSRGYKRAGEKWEVASLALEILHKLLLTHEVSAGDFTDQCLDSPGLDGTPLPKPPGHVILQHMFNDSKLLRKVRSVIDGAWLVLCDPAQHPSEPLAHSALLALKIVATTFSKEQDFLNQLRQSQNQDRTVSVSPLHELLGSINSRTGKADYTITIARYVGLTEASPELPLTAVQVLTLLSSSHTAGNKTTTHIINDKSACSEILQGFVEQIEADIEPPSSSDEVSPPTLASVHQQLKQSILTLLSKTVDNPPPSMAHLLLGYDTTSESRVSESILQDPGVMGSPRNCLHSVLALLDHSQESSGCHYSNPKLAELAYKLVYQLCSNSYLSSPTLRYLRSNHDFFYNQLLKLPLESRGSTFSVSINNENAWLLKSMAVELRMTSLNHQRSHAQRIIHQLLDEPTNQSTAGDHMTFEDSDFDYLQEKRRKILLILDAVDFSEQPLPALELQFFDQTAMEEAIKSCNTKDGVSGVVLVDVGALKRVLMSELNTLQGTGVSSQRQSILEEIQEILEVVEQRNKAVSSNHSNLELFESWRQVVEVSLHCLAQVGINRELKVKVLFEILQDLLMKVSSSEGSELSTSVHGVVLILLSHLRQTLAADNSQHQGNLSSLYIGPLHTVLKGLVENLLKCSSSNQKTRVYLVGALLYYLVLTKSDASRKDTGGGLWRMDSEDDALSAGNMVILTSYGEPFMDLVCKNACSWHAVTRMLSLSLLDSIVALDPSHSWIRFLSAKGYLLTLCSGLLSEDQVLVKTAVPTPELSRALYTYESKMAFLSRVAKDSTGGQELVAINAVNYLSQCKFIDNRPSRHDDGHMTGSEAGFVPSVWERYRQAFLPLLRFLVATLTSQGPHHKEACAQVTDLIGCHSDVFASVLKEQHRVVTMATLQELALVTDVIGHSDVGHDWSSRLTTPYGAGLVRLQRLMLSLLPHYWSKQSWSDLTSQAVGADPQRSGDPLLREEAWLLVQQISTNLVSYCRVSMTIGGTELSSQYCRILFTPNLTQALLAGRHGYRESDSQSLGLVVQHLRDCVEGYSSALETQDQLQKKIDSGSLSMEDIRNLLPPGVSMDKLSSGEQQSMATLRLKQQLTNKQKELHHFAYLVENLLYLLWRHLYYYLFLCKPVESGPELLGVARPAMRRLHVQEPSPLLGSGSMAGGAGGVDEGVSREQLDQLRADVGKALTDPLLKKVLEVEEAQLRSKVEMRVGFIQSLVRRVRKFIKLKADSRPVL